MAITERVCRWAGGVNKSHSQLILNYFIQTPNVRHVPQSVARRQSPLIHPHHPTHHPPNQNDDGPPGQESPYIFGLYQHLTNHLSEHPLG